MKKNILLVHSFLVLPLLASSFIFSSEKRNDDFPILLQPSLKNSGSQQRKNRKERRREQPSAPQIVEQFIETKTPAIKHVEAIAPIVLAASEEQVTPQETVKTKNTSKYLITELSTEEQTQAKHDLEKAKSNSKNLVGFFSVIKTLSDQKSAQENGLRHVEIKTTTHETPAPAKVIQITLSEDLEKSVMSPSESKGFGFADIIFNTIRSYRTTIIKLLGNETFEPTNADHKKYFNLALEECATHKDTQSLTQILHLCKEKEKYNNLQSSLNHVAPAFNFFADDFATAITASNRALVTYNQECTMQINRASAELHEKLTGLLNDHREKVTAIAKMYNDRVDNEQENYSNKKALLASISALNAKVKSYEHELLFEYTLQIPTNAVAAIENDTHMKVRRLLTNKNMPQAKTLQLTDK